MSRECVRWRGVNADYSHGERQIMSGLPVKEQFIVHTLKSFTDGEIGEGAVEKARPGCGSAVEVRPPSPIVYTDPEDIPFGRPKIVYALAWTADRARRFKTKDGKKKPWEAAAHKMRVWKKWYERQGWTIYGSGSWHIAKSPTGELRAAVIREYDRETKERL